MKTLLVAFMMLPFVAGGSGCSDETQTEVVHVSAEKVMCPSYLSTAAMCPQVIRSSGVSHNVIGFEHQWGHRYTLIVEVEQAPDNLADAPREFLHLKSVVSEVMVPPGMEFSILARPVAVVEWDEVSGVGVLGDPSKSFRCDDTEVCAALTSALEKSEYFDMTFEFGAPVDGDLILLEVTSR